MVKTLVMEMLHCNQALVENSGDLVLFQRAAFAFMDKLIQGDSFGIVHDDVECVFSLYELLQVYNVGVT